MVVRREGTGYLMSENGIGFKGRGSVACADGKKWVDGGMTINVFLSGVDLVVCILFLPTGGFSTLP